MTTIHKIIAINHLYNDNLPDNIVEMINGFVFYDIEQWTIKECKKQIQQILSEGTYIPEVNGNGHWALHFDHVRQNRDHLQFQVINCKKCGNYLYVSSFHFSLLHHNVRCNCI